MKYYLLIITGLLAAAICLAQPVWGTVNLQSYCKDGFYQIPGEKKCSRAPHCGGFDYDQLNKIEFMPNPNDCLDEGAGMIVGNPPASSAFYGYVPLCCYEMARTKNPEMCIGYWERLWCHPEQCSEINNETGCGGGACQCAHAMKGWCEMRNCTMLPPVPLEVRLGMQPKPTAIPPSTKPPQRTPSPTLIPPSAFPTLPHPTDIPIPTQVSRPTSTPAPFSISTPAPVNHESEANQEIQPLPLSPSSVKPILYRVVALINPGLAEAGRLIGSLIEADRELEYQINSRILRIYESFRSKISPQIKGSIFR